MPTTLSWYYDIEAEMSKRSLFARVGFSLRVDVYLHDYQMCHQVNGVFPLGLKDGLVGQSRVLQDAQV